MTIVVSPEVLKTEGLTLKDFGVLLYYAGGGRGTIDSESCDLLWNKNLLVKVLDGYEFNYHARRKFEEWAVDSRTPKQDDKRFKELADKLRALYPEGKKEGTIYTWRDNTITIAKKLKTLCDKFQCTFTDEEAIAATKRYIESFHGNYRYMQLLKYFILKRDNDKMEETSQLLSFIQAGDTLEDDTLFRPDNGELL